MKKALSILLTAALALSLALPALAAPSSFTDVPEDAPYAEAVAYVRDRGIMNGTAETTFDPRTACGDSLPRLRQSDCGKRRVFQ